LKNSPNIDNELLYEINDFIDESNIHEEIANLYSKLVKNYLHNLPL